MTKEWKILNVGSSADSINKLTKEGWTVEYVIPGHSYGRDSGHMRGKIFLSRERKD